jgi:hypothetical protein
MIEYILIVFFLCFVIYKERQALGCPNIPDGTDCDNENGKAVKGTKPYITDTNEDIYDKIKKASKFMDRWVIWRLSILIGLISILFLIFFLYQRLPDIKELIIGMFVISYVVYFTINFYKFHLIDYIKNNILDSIEILKSRNL